MLGKNSKKEVRKNKKWNERMISDSDKRKVIFEKKKKLNVSYLI